MNAASEERLSLVAWLVAFLSVVGLAAAGFSLYEHVVYTNGLASGPSVCSISAYIDCTKVNTSEWSKFFGLPLGAYGIFFYLALLGLSLVAIFAPSVSKSDVLSVVFTASLVASGFSVFLFAVSHFIIGALCLMCLTLYVVNFLLLGVATFGAWRGRIGEAVSTSLDAFGRFLGVTVLLMPARSSGVAILARVGLVLLIVLAIFSIQLPDRLFSYLAGPQDPTTSSMVREAVARWQKEPLLVPTVIDGTGTDADMREGDPRAPISIVEFADFECGGCRRMYTRLHEVLKDFTGSYSFVFKNYPLDNQCNPFISRPFHRHACTAALFTRCAGEQGKLKESIDLVFTDPLLDDPGELSEAKVKDEFIAKAVSRLGLDGEGLRECLDSKRYLSKIKADVEEGHRLGLEVTPSLWVNGRLVKGANPDVLRAVFKTIVPTNSKP